MNCTKTSPSSLLITATTFIVVAVISSVILLSAQTTPAVDSFGLLSRLPRNWHPLLNFSTNAFHHWRISPMLEASLRFFFGPTVLPTAAMALSAAIFSCGFLMITRRTLGCTLSAVSALVLTRGLLALYGHDAVVLHSIAWFPWLTLVLRRYRDPSTAAAPLLAGAFLIGAFISLSANQLAPFILLGSCLAAYGDRQATSPRPILPIIAATALPIMVFIYQIPIPAIPDYPHNAHVVPDDGLAGMLRPLITANPVIPLIDRSAIHALYALPVIVGCAAALLLTLLYSRDDKRLRVAAALILFAMAALDAAVPERLAQIAPLATLARLLPGAFYIPATPIIFAMALTALMMVLDKRSGTLLAACSAFYYLTTISGCFGTPLPQRSILQHSRAADLVARISAVSDGHSKSGEKPVWLERLLTSPSAYIAAHLGLWTFQRPIVAQELAAEPLRLYRPSVLASHQNEPRFLKRLHDKRVKSRWTTNRGGQAGDEWIAIRLSEPVTLSGIKFPPGGSHHTDFPRGLRVSIKESCESVNEIAKNKSLLPIVEIREWQGALRYTSSGHPYLTPQAVVEVIFPKKQRAQCILVEQIGRNNIFDWSIAEIYLLIEMEVLSRLAPK